MAKQSLYMRQSAGSIPASPMLGCPGPVPFEGSRVYGPYDMGGKNKGRMTVRLKPASSDKPASTMTYARYLMSVHLRRKLLGTEHVDHINEDHADDRIENLQVLSPSANSMKRSLFQPPALVAMTCSGCGVGFTRRKNQDKRRWTSKLAYHSRACYLTSRI